MKEINGTISLAYIEEDNKQRVIFRVLPLCTREGSTFHGGAEDFPDVGSLRIVPDKREQSTFKDRMRAIGGLCTIHLLNDGKELMKVRQNRNYTPEQGEHNQFAIYSDVICEFVEDGCFEVVELGADAQSALTEKVLLHKNKVLYGPVTRQEAEKASLEAIKPFGNDRFLLHTIETSKIGKHLVYWDPEATLTWRQRRNTLRRREKDGDEEGEQEPFANAVEAIDDEAEEPKGLARQAPIAQASAPVVEQEEPPAEAASASEKRFNTARVNPHIRRSERAAEVLRQDIAQKKEKTEKGQDVPLPIGTKLEILDMEVPFDQQINRLAQPLSESANRLMHDLPETTEESPQETIAHFSGTPLVQSAGRITRSVVHPESMHHVVERQMRKQREESVGNDIYEMMENPMENLRLSVEYVWQDVDMREQAIAMLMENESFVYDLLRAFRRSGLSTQASAAAQEQLAEIEAERLSLLMQMETAKVNEKKFREAAIASLSQKRRDEVERLNRDIKELEASKQRLTEASRILSDTVAQDATDFLANHIQCLTGAGERRVLLSPIIGCHYSQQEMAEKLRVHMSDSGFSLNEDDAMSLLIHFSLCDTVCFRARTIADAQLFSTVLLESFGLKSVCATVCPGSYVEMISLLPEDLRRTPTVTVQPLGTETMAVYGHKTVFLCDEATMSNGDMLLQPHPVINVSPMMKRAFGRTSEWHAIAPAALSSFASIRGDAHPMLHEAEQWFAQLKRGLSNSEICLSDAMLIGMRRFIEVASSKVRGGFLAAADTAICHWVVPVLLENKDVAHKMGELLAGLPHTLSLLGIQ